MPRGRGPWLSSEEVRQVEKGNLGEGSCTQPGLEAEREFAHSTTQQPVGKRAWGRQVFVAGESESKWAVHLGLPGRLLQAVPATPTASDFSLSLLASRLLLVSKVPNFLRHAPLSLLLGLQTQVWG